jgi:hypothetical protein
MRASKPKEEPKVLQPPLPTPLPQKVQAHPLSQLVQKEMSDEEELPVRKKTGPRMPDNFGLWDSKKRPLISQEVDKKAPSQHVPIKVDQCSTSRDMRLQEMISLNIKKSSDGGQVKKMLHIPTMTIKAVKEFPIGNLSKTEWLTKVEAASQLGVPRLVKVMGVFFNQPVGRVSVVMEWVDGGSLEGLMEEVGLLGESTVLRIARGIIEAASSLADLGRNLGDVRASQVLLTKDGDVKLGLGGLLENKQEHHDFRQLSYILEQALYGTIDQQVVKSHRNISQNAQLLITLLKEPGISAKQLLCLPIFTKISGHCCTFGTGGDQITNDVRLTELLKVANFWEPACEPEYSERQLETMSDLIETVLKNSQKWFDDQRISQLHDLLFLNEKTASIQDIARDLGLPPAHVLSAFQKAILAVPSIKKLKTHLGI